MRTIYVLKQGLVLSLEQKEILKQIDHEFSQRDFILSKMTKKHKDYIDRLYEQTIGETIDNKAIFGSLSEVNRKEINVRDYGKFRSKKTLLLWLAEFKQNVPAESMAYKAYSALRNRHSFALLLGSSYDRILTN